MDEAKEIEKLKQINQNNKEGFVLKFNNNFRMKIKFETYIKMHRLVKCYSDKQIWSFLQRGEDIPIENVPDEEYDNIKKVKEHFINRFKSIKEAFLEEHKLIKRNSFDGKDTLNRIKSSSNQAIIFRIDKQKNVDHLIWKILKPMHNTYP